MPNAEVVRGAEVYEPGKIANVNDRIRFSSDASLNFIKDLTYKISLSLEYTRGMQDVFNESRRTLRAYNRSGTSESRNLLFQNTLNYAPKFGDGHSINFLLGQSAEKIETKVTNVNSVSAAPTLSETVNWPRGNSIGSSNYTASSILSYFSRLDYSYNQKYMIGGSLRADGSSKFGQANRWGIFPSVSAGWNFAKEDIFAGMDWLVNGKVRASYGISGTTWDNDYLALGVIGSLSLVRDNRVGFGLINTIMLGGLLLAAFASFLFSKGVISGYQWMLQLGIGTFLAYITAQTVLFERMIALFKIKANAGYFVYLCDSTGYLGSVALLVYKEFFTRELQWSEVLLSFVHFQTVTGLVFLTICLIFFARKMGREKVSMKVV